MESFKKFSCAIFVLLMVLNLAACGPEVPATEPDKSTPSLNQTAPPANTEQDIIDPSPADTLLAGTPAHINKTYSETFSVDADVRVPDIEAADVLYAKLTQFDEQTLLSLFYNGNAPNRETYSEDNAVSYKDDSAYLMFSGGRIYYRTQDFEYAMFATESFASLNDIYSANKRFDEVYVRDNLSFMSRMEAFTTVSDVLRLLSIDVSDNAEIYAIDFQTMQTQQGERIQREIDIQKNIGVSPIHDPTDGYKTKDGFTQDDDFYILYLTMMQGGVPVTQKSYNIMAGERTLNGSTARVSFSTNGIIQLDCTGIYQQQGIADSVGTLISVEDALKNAYEIHNAVITTDKLTVTAINFEYVPVPYNNSYDEVKLTPAWSLTVSYERDVSSKGGKETSEKSIVTRMIFIDAITGEEIK